MPALKAVQLPLFWLAPGEGQLEGKVYENNGHFTAVIANWWLGTGTTKDAAIKSAIAAYEAEVSKYENYT